MFGTCCLTLFLRESDIFRREIRGFYLGELLHKAKTLKSGRPLAQMVSQSTYETWRPTEERPRHIIFKHNHTTQLRASFPVSVFSPSHFSTLSSSRDHYWTGPNPFGCFFVCFDCPSPCAQYIKSCHFWTLRLRVCLQNRTDSSVLRLPGCTPPELIQNPVDLSQRKSCTISGVQSLLLCLRSRDALLTAATTVPPQRPDMVFPDPRVLCVAVFYLHCLLCLI